MNYKHGIIIALLGITLFTACTKEEVDTTDIDEEVLNPVVVDCDDLALGFEVTIDSMIGEFMLIANVSGGTEPYSFVWSNGDISNGSTSSSVILDVSGDFSVSVVDSEGCSLNDTYSNGPVDDCNDMFVSISTDSTGFLLFADVSGGNAPYNYNWSTGETTESILVVDPGTYNVVVVDANGCVYTVSHLVEDSGQDPCNGLSMYMYQDSVNFNLLTAEGFNGTPPLFYSWSTGETGQTIEVESGNTYSATVTDVAGCLVFDSYFVQ